MKKMSLYPKTTRVKEKGYTVITEKLDGSNIGFFNQNGRLLIATRKNIFYLDELEDVKAMVYKGMYQWLIDNGQDLLDNLFLDSGLFGEWRGMGQLKYSDYEFPGRVVMFAKARIDDELNVTQINYNVDYLKFAFDSQELPEYISAPVIVERSTKVVDKVYLDVLYDNYCSERTNVEGFIIIRNDYTVEKYVRRKSKKLIDHFE